MYIFYNYLVIVDHWLTIYNVNMLENNRGYPQGQGTEYLTFEEFIGVVLSVSLERT